MYQNNQFDKWDQLERLVRQRLQGQRDEAFEEALLNDEFLQAVVSGLALELQGDPKREIAPSIAEQKQRIWKKMLPAPAPYSPALLINQLRQTWLDLQYAQFQYLLGFNCSCIVLILAFCLWINNSQSPDDILFLTQVEFPDGFKP